MNKTKIFLHICCKAGKRSCFCGKPSKLNSMKFFHLLPAACLLLIFQNIVAQNNPVPTERKCGTMEHLEWLKQQDPGLEARMEKTEADMQAWIKNHPPVTHAVVTIPVVVHVVWNTGSGNIPDQYIQQQIDVLNKDFRRQNSDWTNTPAVFQPLVADCEVEFCLASKDQNGNPTNGIIRVQTSVSSFSHSANEEIKYTALGGSDAWNRDKYLNLWIGPLGGGLLGWATFPNVPAAGDGVVISSSSLPGPPYGGAFDLGRTAVHEIGHWLTLYHIDGDANCGDDQVSDTPTQDMLHSGCPTAPLHTNVCSGSANGEMFMNYLDYVDDACMVMFSSGQKARMVACLNNWRSSLLTSAATNCAAVSTLDAGILSIVSPNWVVCNTTFTPVVKLNNYGINTLSSCTINYRIDANPNQTFNWTGSLTTGQSANITLPSMITTAGTHTFTSFTSSPNSSTDGTPGNDQSSVTFIVSNTGLNLPVVEGIENPVFPPAGWTLNNPDGLTTWSRTTLAKKTGSASMFMDNFDYTAKGQDELISPVLNITAVTNPSLTFQVAYQLYTDPSASPNFSDTLRVEISTDCGITWTNLYNKYSTQLTTVTPTFSTVEFVPDASQWRLETISLTPYSSAAKALIKFRHLSNYENNLYVDDINITGVVGINDTDMDTGIRIYPNPASGKFWVSIPSGQASGIEVYNVFGEKVYSEKTLTPIVIGAKSLILNLDLPNGIYFLRVSAPSEQEKTGIETIHAKIVIQ
ncbi:MAG: T9SS type A sorting domain-containing protein [Bacteroidetes bacterium]|nr:MAG: T9SS type A sorting domain-containing protein [Bacteroidota bacterium]